MKGLPKKISSNLNKGYSMTEETKRYAIVAAFIFFAAAMIGLVCGVVCAWAGAGHKAVGIVTGVVLAILCVLIDMEAK